MSRYFELKTELINKKNELNSLRKREDFLLNQFEKSRGDFEANKYKVIGPAHDKFIKKMAAIDCNIEILKEEISMINAELWNISQKDFVNEDKMEDKVLVKEILKKSAILASIIILLNKGNIDNALERAIDRHFELEDAKRHIASIFTIEKNEDVDYTVNTIDEEEHKSPFTNDVISEDDYVLYPVDSFDLEYDVRKEVTTKGIQITYPISIEDVYVDGMGTGYSIDTITDALKKSNKSLKYKKRLNEVETQLKQKYEN